MADQPVLYAHRGTNPYTDNEADAYKWAFKYGADFIEIDLRLTKDGELVSYHDDLPGGIANMTYAEVKAAVPGIITFDQIIALTKQMELETGRKLGILVETKSTGYATYDAMLADLVAADFADPERIVFQTFATDHKVLRDLMDDKYDVDFPLVWLTDNITDAKIANVTNPQGTMGELDGLAPQMALITKETVAAAQAAGLKVNGWTVAGNESDVRNALSLGVDGIINDNTQLARPALEKLLNGATVVYGTDLGTEINGGTDEDVIYAMSGDDIVRGGLGDDVLYGDAGNDLLFGGAGNDRLVGGSGNDYLAGGTGADILSGGAGNDVIVATGDQVVFRAGDGIDLVSLDSTSTIVFDGVAPAGVSVIRNGNNLIIRAGNDALVLLNGVDPAHLPASITTADGFTLTGAQLAALAVDGTDAEVAAVLPGLQDLLANAPALAIPSSVAVGTDLVAAGDFPEGTLSYDVPSVETGAVYRLSFSLADLPTGDDGVRVLWGGQVIFEGVPSAGGDKLHFMLKGGAGDGSNDLVFEGAGESFGATLDDLRLLKVADPVLPSPGNVAPETPDVDLVISQDVPFSGKVVATDANGDTLTYSLGDGPAHGTLVFNADGTYRYTPAAGFTGADSFSYLVNDGHGGIVESTVDFTVAQGILLGTDLMVNGSFEDISESSGNNGPSDWGYRNQDGQILGWTNVNNKRIEQHWDNYGGVVAKDGRMWIDMDHSQTGTTVDRIGQSIAHVETDATYRVSFSLSDSDRNNYDDGVIVLWNGEVIFDGLPPQTSASWTTLSFEVKGGSGNGTNRLEFIDKGVTDSWGAGTALDDVRFVKIANVGDTLPANQAPTAVDGQAQGLKDTVISGQLSATDQDADSSLIYSLGTAAAHGTVFVYTDGTYRYTPTAGFSGADSFTYLVDDGRGGKDTATVNLTVKSSTSQVAIGTDLIVNGSFEDISESSGYNGGADWGYRNLDGQILGWTNANFKRIEQHLDNYGGVVAKDGKFWIDMDGAGQTARNRIGQTISQAETDATYRVSFSLSDSDTGRFDDGIIVLWNGEVIFDGLPPQTGASWVTLSFEVKGGSGNGTNRLEFMDTGVKDSWGAGVALDDVHFVKIADAGDTLPVNHAPTAVDSEVSGLLNALVTGQVSASDQDAGSSLIFSLKQAAAHGTVFVYTDGTYRYMPATGFTGEDSFTVLVNDGRGGKTEATVNLTISPPNAVPVAANDTGLGTQYGAVLTIDPALLLANDTDADGDTLVILSVAAGAGGTVALDVNGRVVFTPAEGFEGEASFSYVVSDGKGGTATGNVIVTVAPEPEVPAGTAGDDTITGTAGDDVIAAQAGDDEVSGGAGDDVIDGGEGDDTLSGDEGDDLLKGGADDDALFGGVGNDVLIGGAGDDLLDGGDGIDTANYSGDTAGVTVNLAEGYAEGDEAGSDELVSIENVIGGAGDDTLIGDDGDNVFVGGLGHNVIDGGAGFDTLDLSAATGPVTVDFAGGKASGSGIGTNSFSNIEKLLFGAGNDVVTGGNGAENLDGGAGNDTLKGGAGNDTLAGGEGDDTLDGGSGDDVVTGGIGNDTIKAGSGDDRIEGGEGNDVVDAGSGDDIVLGGAGNDTIDGGSGDDRIVGGAGDDILTGGSGHDVFVFAAGFGKDIVTDFKTTGSSSDVLEFDTDVFADFATAMDAADQVGGDVVFTVDADTTLTLKGVQLSSLAQDDFRFV
ncbi:Ig-like domain-containing protein [Bosea sp. BH3]|uniref:Ig-like domain-containing protein n=1 Tax=Bosea sp. BH3 TaxID=2871701 RepID=UPI0021CB001C|nr:Ig-like domain-containing protein [Bosea sp. BH3]MCU4179722.1 tandem-95 repeat protein [Bosea sp. BH3]